MAAEHIPEQQIALVRQIAGIVHEFREHPARFTKFELFCGLSFGPDPVSGVIRVSPSKQEEQFRCKDEELLGHAGSERDAFFDAVDIFASSGAALAWNGESPKKDFHVAREWPVGELRYAWLCPAGDGSLHIEIVGGNAPEPNPEFGTIEETLEYSGYHHVCIDVANLDRALEALRRRGVAALGDPIVMAAVGRRIAFIADPWGNLVELAEASG